MKISGNDNFTRTIIILLLILPGLIFYSFIGSFFGFDIFIKPGYLVINSGYILFGFFILRLKIFDWDLYKNHKEVLLKRGFTNTKISVKTDNFTIRPAFYLSPVLKIFILKANNRNYLFTVKEIITIKEKMLNLDSVAKRIEDKLKEE